MTRASIVVPTRGGAARLPVLLHALAEQTHTDWEAIVVIDGDLDGSEQVVRCFAQLPVRAITFPTNRGRVAALNEGFASATGDVFIRADDDFEPGPRHVATHVAAHEERECGVIGLPLNVAPQSPYRRTYGAQADVRGRADAYALPAEQRWRLWGGNTSTSRETYMRVGGFDARYQGYGWEDLDFGYRIHRLGLPIELLPEAEVRHHMASISTRIRADRAYRSGQARARFEQIHGVGSSGHTPRPTSPWNRAVLTAAARLDADRTERVARLVDSALPVLPPSIGRKAVALVVESSSVAGFMRGDAR